MQFKTFLRIAILSTLCLSTTSLTAAKVSLFESIEDAKIYITEHYNRGCEFYNESQWGKAVDAFEKIVYLFPNSPEAAQAYYYLGVALFQLEEYDFANEAFSNYIKASEEPSFFEDAILYKFCIAEHFKCGNKRRLFKIRYCPKWASAYDMALSIYDEVVAALPHHDVAAQALFSKGTLLQMNLQYRESVEAYQLLIRRFPKHELAPESYVRIAQAYCQQSRREFQNPDLLALAEMNVRKFKDDFPREERIELAEGYFNRIKENYAKGLCDMGVFYERICKPMAAIIYYESAIDEFPDTLVADFCRRRLKNMRYEVAEECVISEVEDS